MSNLEYPGRPVAPLLSVADFGARRALAERPPAPLEKVLEQAAASRKFIAEWRAKGLPDLPDTLRRSSPR
jgi:hypothetical protein